MKNNKQIWAIVGVTAVVAIAITLITAGITGNVIRVFTYGQGYQQVYTKAEVDNLIKAPSNKLISTSEGLLLTDATGKTELAKIYRPTVVGGRNVKDPFGMIEFNLKGENSMMTTQLSVVGFNQEMSEKTIKEIHSSTINIEGDNLIMGSKSTNLEGILNYNRRTIVSPGFISLYSEDKSSAPSSALSSEYLQFCNGKNVCITCKPDFTTKTLKCT
ncbi:MAG: hypothetical protein WC781_04140 [Candidatus Pacearchaeota archaeon]